MVSQGGGDVGERKVELVFFFNVGWFVRIVRTEQEGMMEEMDHASVVFKYFKITSFFWIS